MTMKSVTLIAVIATVIQTIASFYYLLINFEVLHYDSDIQKVMQPLFFLSSVGLMVFFIQLYNKQPKN